MSKKQSLRTWRRFRNLTQQELADEIGVSMMTISLYESGALEKASYKTIVALAKALDISLEQLEVKDNEGI